MRRLSMFWVLPVIVAVAVAAGLLLSAPVFHVAAAGSAGPLPTEAPPPAWTSAVEIPSSSIRLPGTWASVETFAPPTITRDADGNIADVRVHQLTDELLVVDRAEVDRVAAAGRAVPLDRIPTDCRACLRWSADTGRAWYAFDYAPRDVLARNGCDCGVDLAGKSLTHADREAGEVVQEKRVARAVFLAGVDNPEAAEGGVTPTGPGEIQILRDGTISIGPGADDGPPEDFAILSAATEQGDRFFWVVRTSP